MKAILLTLLAVATLAAGADDVTSHTVSRQRGPYLERETYWFRGTQCIACVRGYADKRARAIEFLEFIDFFHAGRRVATWDPQAFSLVHIRVPAGLNLHKDFSRITIYSEDLSQFEQVELVPGGLKVQDTARRAEALEAFRSRKQDSPQQLAFLRSYPAIEAAPKLEDVRARADKTSR